MLTYEIHGPARQCTLTGQELHPGDKCYSALFEEHGKFVRKDFARSAWETPPPGAIAWWQSTVPNGQKPKKLTINDNLLLECFQHLEKATEDRRLNFRFVVTLLLVRRKILRLDDSFRRDGKDFLLVRNLKTNQVHEVLDPQMTDEDIEAVQEEIFQILEWE
ncbi:MAG: hypothetical protein R3B84_00115 [Zavarzinella sp.]